VPPAAALLAATIRIRHFPTQGRLALFAAQSNCKEYPLNRRKTETVRELDLSIHYRPIALKAVLAAHTVLATGPKNNEDGLPLQRRIAGALLTSERD
jgi:hypothetical protein